MEFDERQGFGFAVKGALQSVQTPYVLVVQHDRPFMRPVNIPAIVRAMQAQPQRFKFVGLPTNSTIGHQELVLSKYGIKIEPVEVGAGLQFLPLIQWYDSTHVCETKYYREFVFGPRKLVAKGGFIEDKLGQEELALIKKNGVEAAHPEFGTFVAVGPWFPEPVVGHLDGRDAFNVTKFKFADPAVIEATKEAASQAGPMKGKSATSSSSPPLRSSGSFTIKESGEVEVQPPAHAPVTAPPPPPTAPPKLPLTAAADTPPPPTEAAKSVPEVALPRSSRGPKGQSKGAGATPVPVGQVPVPAAARSSQIQGQGDPAEAQQRRAKAGAGKGKVQCPKHGWQYMDPDRKVHGPFSLQEMQQWDRQGYFRADLLIRCNPNDPFVPLGQMFPTSAVRFESLPKRPRAAPQQAWQSWAPPSNYAWPR